MAKWKVNELWGAHIEPKVRQIRQRTGSSNWDRNKEIQCKMWTMMTSLYRPNNAVMKMQCINICEVFRTVLGHSKLLIHIICCHSQSVPSAVLGMGEIKMEKHCVGTADNEVIVTVQYLKMSLKCYWWSDSCVMRRTNTKKIMSSEQSSKRKPCFTQLLLM